MSESIHDAVLWVFITIICLAVLAFLLSLFVPRRPWHAPRWPLTLCSVLVGLIASAAYVWAGGTINGWPFFCWGQCPVAG